MIKLIFLLLITIFASSNHSVVKSEKDSVKINTPQLGTAVYCERETDDGPCIEKIRE